MYTYIGLLVKCLLQLSDSNEIDGFSENSINMKFYENPSRGIRVVPCGQMEGQIQT